MGKRDKVPRTINAFTARTHLGRLIRLAAEDGETFVLTKKGKPKVVLLGISQADRTLSGCSAHGIVP